MTEGCGVSFWVGENVLEIEVVVAQHCEALNATELFMSKWLVLYYVDFTLANKNGSKFSLIPLKSLTH